ncbi:class I SAM-dependent methyltransferase [Thiobacillus sp.]
MNKAVFKRTDNPMPLAELEKHFRLGKSYVWEYLRGTNNTPVRAITDKAIIALMPYLENDGQIIELGSGTDFYKNLAPKSQEFLTSNLLPGFDLQLDMTQLALDDSSVDAFISLYALEHIFDFKATITEVYRCLKPGGRYLIVNPFLYYYHAAPDDYFRFTMSALEKLFSDFNILYKTPLGNRELLTAEFYLELDVMGFSSSPASRLINRMIGTFFCAKGISSRNDMMFAASNLLLCEKR